ncbi:hypothetical protein [Allorhizobium sonneratiae]|uniref:hypothetical protein n=1 Tax=Allorhizobium sonneratiae TaxID=2934936 RepID=UPI0020347833|nr:hypothetical protein [Allorhizobium sonneratiae]
MSSWQWLVIESYSFREIRKGFQSSLFISAGDGLYQPRGKKSMMAHGSRGIFMKIQAFLRRFAERVTRLPQTISGRDDSFARRSGVSWRNSADHAGSPEVFRVRASEGRSGTIYDRAGRL